jgi:hypothetical protein
MLREDFPAMGGCCKKEWLQATKNGAPILRNVRSHTQAGLVTAYTEACPLSKLQHLLNHHGHRHRGSVIGTSTLLSLIRVIRDHD